MINICIDLGTLHVLIMIQLNTIYGWARAVQSCINVRLLNVFGFTIFLRCHPKVLISVESSCLLIFMFILNISRRIPLGSNAVLANDNSTDRNLVKCRPMLVIRFTSS